MGRRKRNDVFVIGEEQLAETQALPEPEREEPPGDQEPGGTPPPGLGRPSAGDSQRARWRAALGIGAVAAAALGTLELSSSGAPQRSQGDETSARPSLVQRPAPGAAVAPAPGRPPLLTSREDRPGTSRSPKQRPQVPESEPEREPVLTTAPVSSPTSPLPVAEPPPAATPPSPPPPSSGGGPGGVEDFGFER
jgi:hypothetical protein